MALAVITLFSLIALVGPSGCTGSALSPSDGSPRITAIEPAAGRVETKVVLKGSAFLDKGNVVRFGPGYLRGLDSPDGITLEFRVPDGLDACGPRTSGPCTGGYQRLGPGSYEVSVVTRDASSNTVTFTVLETR